MAQKKIHIQECDIKGAKPCAEGSPTARAIRRTLRLEPETRVAVWHGRVAIGKKTYKLPSSVDAAERLFNMEKCMMVSDFLLDNTPLKPEEI